MRYKETYWAVNDKLVSIINYTHSDVCIWIKIVTVKPTLLTDLLKEPRETSWNY